MCCFGGVQAKGKKQRAKSKERGKEVWKERGKGNSSFLSFLPSLPLCPMPSLSLKKV